MGYFYYYYCALVPHSYQVSHTADVFYARIENSTATLTAIINYTVVINSLQFNGFVLQATLSLLGTSRTEIYFRLSNGTTSRLHIIGDPELMIDGSMTVIRESIILFNSPVPVDTYVFELGVIVFGSDHTFGLTTSMVLVQVVESTGKIIF